MVPRSERRVHDAGRCAEVAVSPPRCMVPGAERGAQQPCEVDGAQQPLRPMLVAPLSAPCAAGLQGALRQQVSSQPVALCHLQPGASRPGRFLWQGCGVSAGPRPGVCVRARYFLPAPWGQGPFVSSSQHRVSQGWVQQLLTCLGTAASAQKRHPEVRFMGGAGSRLPSSHPPSVWTPALDLPLSTYPPYNPMGHSGLPVPPRAGMGLPATGPTPEHAAVTLGPVLPVWCTGCLLPRAGPWC